MFDYETVTACLEAKIHPPRAEAPIQLVGHQKFGNLRKVLQHAEWQIHQHVQPATPWLLALQDRGGLVHKVLRLLTHIAASSETKRWMDVVKWST